MTFTLLKSFVPETLPLILQDHHILGPGAFFPRPAFSPLSDFISFNTRIFLVCCQVLPRLFVLNLTLKFFLLPISLPSLPLLLTLCGLPLRSPFRLCHLRGGGSPASSGPGVWPSSCRHFPLAFGPFGCSSLRLFTSQLTRSPLSLVPRPLPYAEARWGVAGLAVSCSGIPEHALDVPQSMYLTYIRTAPRVYKARRA